MKNLRKLAPSAKEKFSEKAELYAEQTAEILDNLGAEAKKRKAKLPPGDLLVAAAIIQGTIANKR
ncbi:MAG: hypothetical protein ACR2P4_01000 [Gammaproteobacteria bacterium]